jgi:hypothetical protein
MLLPGPAASACGPAAARCSAGRKGAGAPGRMNVRAHRAVRAGVARASEGRLRRSGSRQGGPGTWERAGADGLLVAETRSTLPGMQRDMGSNSELPRSGERYNTRTGDQCRRTRGLRVRCFVRLFSFNLCLSMLARVVSCHFVRPPASAPRRRCRVLPGRTGAYRGVRANMEQTSMRTGLDHCGEGRRTRTRERPWASSAMV